MVNILIILLVLVAIVFALDKIAAKVLFPYTRSLDETAEMEKENDNWKDYDDKDKEEIDYLLSDGYLIHGTMVWTDKNSDKFVIMSHGFRFSRHGGIKYIDSFAQRGYNIYLYDLRSHGANEKGIIGMGEGESKDLIEIINLTKKRFGNDIKIGLQGESLGAFTSLMVLADCPFISFCVEDCAYSNTRKELIHQMGRNKIPPFIYEILAVYVKIRYKQHWNDMDAVRAIKKSNVPVLFIHGESDTFTPPWMAKTLYESCNAEKKLIYFEGAEHASSQMSNPSLYKKEVNSFLESINC